MKTDAKSYILVIIQLACLVFIGSTGPWIPSNPLSLLLLVCGFIIGGWAVWEIEKHSHLAITPQVTKGASLVTSGPYKILRHPIYSALLMMLIALIINSPSLLRLMVAGVLTMVLIIKLIYEESLLEKKFPNYRKYKSSSYRLIPYLW